MQLQQAFHVSRIHFRHESGSFSGSRDTLIRSIGKSSSPNVLMTSYSFVTTYKDSLLNQDFDYEEVCKESFESLHCHETDEKDDHYH